MMNVDYFKLLAHIFFKFGDCRKQIVDLDVKKEVDFKEHCFSETRDYFACYRR